MIDEHRRRRPGWLDTGVAGEVGVVVGAWVDVGGRWLAGRFRRPSLRCRWCLRHLGLGGLGVWHGRTSRRRPGRRTPRARGQNVAGRRRQQPKGR